MSLLRFILAGLAGALVAGAAAGLIEGGVVFAGDPAAGSTAPLYGLAFYALLLGGAGLGTGLAAFALSKLKPAWSITERWAWAASLAAVFVPVALVVIRFRVIRDVFHEKLPLASPAGVGVHLGLLALGAVLGAALWWLLRPAERAPLGRQPWPKLSAVALAALALIGAPFLALGGADAPQLKPPTASKEHGPVILIMVDTLRADRLGSYGYSKAKTPHLDALARDAVQYDNAFAQASWTRPSVATLLTSLPPSAHATMYKADRLPESVDTLGEAFQRAGWRTGGLVTNYNIAPYFNFAQGFDDYRYLDPDYFWWADEGSSKLSLYNLARVVRDKVAPEKDSPSYYYQDAAVTTDAALRFVDDHKDEPFLLYVSYMDPHDPYFARPLNGEMVSRAATINPDPGQAQRMSDLYDGEIAWWDQHFGRLVAHLKAQGLYDKATLVITSDHGEEFQEHGGWWHGTTLYDEQIHVPLLIKRPGNQGGGTRVKALARLMDVPPTLAATVKVAPPASWRGRDLLADTDEPAAVYAEEDHQGNVLRALRGREWKLIEANPDNPRGLAPVELYRIDRDPAEKENLADKEQTVVGTQRKAMHDAATGAATGAAKRDAHELDSDSERLLKEIGYIE